MHCKQQIVLKKILTIKTSDVTITLKELENSIMRNNHCQVEMICHSRVHTMPETVVNLVNHTEYARATRNSNKMFTKTKVKRFLL